MFNFFRVTRFFSAVNRNLRDKVANLEAVIQICTDVIKEKDVQISDLVAEIENTKTYINALNSRIHEHEDTIDDQRGRLTGLCATVEMLEVNVNESYTENTRLNARIVEFEDPFGLEQTYPRYSDNV